MAERDVVYIEWRLGDHESQGSGCTRAWYFAGKIQLMMVLLSCYLS
jgi:hypothetical protein